MVAQIPMSMPALTSHDRRLELSHAVNRLSDAILRGDTTNDILQSLVDIAGPTLWADRALIYDVSYSRGTAVALCEWLEPTSHVSPTKNTYPLSLFATAAREFARNGAPIESSRANVNPLLAADGADELLHNQMSIQRLLWHPIRRFDDGCYLLVLNQVRQDRGWTSEELEFVGVVAGQVNLALMKVELLREQERTATELRTSDNRFRLFYDSTPSMFFTVDRAGIVRSLNAYAERRLGYSTSELLNKSVLSIVHPDDQNAVMNHLAACFDDPGEVRGTAFRKVCKDGSIIWVKETTRVGDSPDGASAYIVCEDVTEARAHEEAAREAEIKSHDKDEFMAMLGHELRNPLAPIVTALEILRRRGRDDEELQLIDRQVAHLRRLVDDLLDVSRITRGHVELHMEPIDIANVVAQAVEVARPLFLRKRQRLTVDAASGLTVLGDHSRLVQAIANLLTNAAKFSTDGQEVRLSAEGRGDRVLITVTDQGEGIEPEMLDRVFDLFVQRGQPADRAQSGLGLGLTIVRNLVTLHGGTVRATSEGRGKGTVVIVELPTATMSSQPLARSSSDRPRPVGDSDPARSILIVDDNDDARRSLCRLLQVCGFQATAVGDGPSALAAAAEIQPRIVLIDIGLPGMDGYELARQLRCAYPVGQRLIAITGYGQPSDRVRSRDAGFIAHLVKPVEIETLLPFLESEIGADVRP
jgi:two-component system CheB/CheR fusion protein